MQGFHKPWFIAGGWAIDLFIDQVTREHHDTEIAILRQDQMELKNYLKDWEFNKVRSGTIEPWETGEWIYLPALLYKSKNPKNKDEQDFNHINGLLDIERKAWLKQALQICNSQHEWIKFL
jgi:hypothetical protein